MAAELPFHLKTLEPLPGALDIIRYFGELDEPTADVDEICDALELSERGFSKAIRRLVTKGYVTMEGDMVYRLTEQGQQAAEELAEFDEATGGVRPDTGPKYVSRRLVMALPETLVAQQPAEVVVGFNEADLGHLMAGNADLVLRLSVLNGKPDKPEDAPLVVSNMPVHRVFQVTPGSFTQMRLKVQVFQLNPDSDDVEVSGGMYVDVNVNGSASDAHTVAYGTDVRIAL
ncbi:MAG: winged helix DNA-binding protein [bacterium]|nr:winged helix DNA-binding protein [bacterium]